MEGSWESLSSPAAPTNQSSVKNDESPAASGFRGVRKYSFSTWHRLMARGAFTAASAGEEVVPASELRRPAADP
jgi:hypothetical protein